MPIVFPSPLFARARRRFTALSRSGRAAVVAAVVVPVFAFAAIGAGDDRPGEGGDPVGVPDAARGGDTFLRGATAVLSRDLDREYHDILAAGPAVPTTVDPAYTARAVELMQSLPKDADGNPDWSRVDMDDYRRRIEALGDPAAATTSAPAGPVDFEPLDLDEALDAIAERIDAENAETLDALRDSPQADHPALLMAHAAALMTAGDPWGAAANLLVAHEQDADDATPLVDLAAIANGQSLPAVALALLEAAEARTIADDDSPVGIAERATLLNNRGHALLLLRRYDEAEAPLRAALAASPELSEAARNLVHALGRLGREEEARALLPRAVWRLRGTGEVPVHDPDAAGPPAEPPPPAGTPEQIARWTRAPWLEGADGHARPPLWIALDLSKQGQVAWPAPIYPVADASYAGWFERASSRYVAAHRAAQAFGDQAGAAITSQAARRSTLADHVQQTIETMVSPQWSLEPIDTEMHPLDAAKERLILGGTQRTRFQALDVAQAEWQMERAADRLYERYRRDARCPPGSTTDACCAIHRREVERNLAEMTPIVREYEEQMRVFFRDAYGLSTAIASNLPRGPWHDAARSTIEQQVQLAHWRTQQEMAFAFAHAAPTGSACYVDVAPVGESAPEVAVDASACSAASQWASGKYAFSDAFSMELTCGKLKFVAEVNVIGTKKLKWGPLNELGADLGMHAEIEFTIEGTVTIFAGPKAGVSGKIGGFGGDFGVKDGIYAVIGADGVRDVGMRVVVGGGVAGGSYGGTHDVDSMDFSFASAI